LDGPSCFIWIFYSITEKFMVFGPKSGIIDEKKDKNCGSYEN